MTAIEKVLALANNETGYMEKASNSKLDYKTVNVGSANYTKYARDVDAVDACGYKVQAQPWCATWYFWLFLKTFGLKTALDMLYIKQGFNLAGCTDMASNYKSKGRFFTTPEVGDQAFFKSTSDKNRMAHTGIVTLVKDGEVFTIEGNTSTDNDVIANGGAVCAKKYPLDFYRIAGYGRPNWSLVKSEDEEKPKPVQEEKAIMTFEDFKELMRQYRAELQDNDCGEWSKEARAWGISSGMINGIGTTENGSINYAWADNLTREQAITLFYRFAKLVGIA